MFHSDEIAKGAFFALVDYCDTNECDSCIFYRKQNGCMFSSGELPEMWELPNKK